MTDNEPIYEDAEELEPAEEEERKPTDRRRLATLAAVIIVIVIVVLVLLMLRGCDSMLTSTSRRSSTNQIVPVAGHAPLDGSISVWLSGETPLISALADAGVHSDSSVDMGGGRYVVKVPPGTEIDVIRKLRDLDGVYDAGRVYEDTATK